MDNLIDSTQRFDLPLDQGTEGASPSRGQHEGGNYATQAFVPGDYEDEEEAVEEIAPTQAFAVDTTSTQAFPVVSLDDTISDDPLLYDSSAVVDATQQFSVAEYATVSGSVPGANDSGYGIPLDSDVGQDYVDGLNGVTSGEDVLEGQYQDGEQEVAGEELVEATAEDPEFLDEIASPDPEEPGEQENEEREEEEETVERVQRVNRISSYDEDDQQQTSDNEENYQASSHRRIITEDDEEQADEREQVASDNEELDKKSDVGELIANIFGDSDDEGAASDADEAKDDQDSQHAGDGDGSKDSDDEIRAKLVVAPDFVSDFDLMMERRRAENRRRYRKRKDYDIVNDSDDMINQMITQMKDAAKLDSDLNKQQKPALTKRKLLPTVVKQLKKSDLRSAFIELGVVSVIADWLYPLPDGSLPALEIRTELLKILHQFPTLDHQILKSSQIGKAVMILYKHPKEIKENKDKAGKLINEWARPIFNLQSDYRSLTKEDRIQLDYEHMPLAKKRRISSLDAENKPKADAEKEETPLRPGDKGWIGRARVPQPSTKDYVVRPRWNIESEIRQTSSKKSSSVMDRRIREMKERTKPKKASRAVGVSIEGRKMF